jgi:hypothetical protein
LKLINNSQFKTNILLNDEIINNLDELKHSNTTSKIILDIYAIWFKSNSFGLLLRPINILIDYNELNLYNYKFLDSESSLENDEDIEDENNNNDDEYNADNDEVDDDNVDKNQSLFIKSNNLLNFNDTSSTTSNDEYV